MLSKWKQLRRSWRLGILILAASLMVIGSTFLLAVAVDAPRSDLTRDALDALAAPVYVGFLSQLGNVIWVATATSCLFAWLLLRGRADPDGADQYLLASGLLTAILAGDDAFLVHDRVMVSVLGLPDAAYVAAYGVVVAAYLWTTWRWLLRLEYGLLAAAAVFLGLSVLLDVVAPFSDLETFIEDSLKFTGIAFWAAFYIRAAVRLASQGDRTA